MAHVHGCCFATDLECCWRRYQQTAWALLAGMWSAVELLWHWTLPPTRTAMWKFQSLKRLYHPTRLISHCQRSDRRRSRSCLLRNWRRPANLRSKPRKWRRSVLHALVLLVLAQARARVTQMRMMQQLPHRLLLLLLLLHQRLLQHQPRQLQLLQLPLLLKAHCGVHWAELSAFETALKALQSSCTS